MIGLLAALTTVIPFCDSDTNNCKAMIQAATAPQVALMLAAPPCGTPEALKSQVCIQWKVAPCPPAWAKPKDDRFGLTQPEVPIGCPLPELRP